MMRNILFVIPVILFAAFAGLAFQGMQRDDTETLPSVVVGGPTPAIQMEPLPGLIPFAAEDLLGADVTIVNFWASWCAPCRAEHPHLVTLAEKGVPVFGINYRDDPENALAFLNELGNPFEGGGADPRGRMAVDWGVYGLPETFLIGSDGTVLYRLAGPLTQRIWDGRATPAMADRGVQLPKLTP